MAQRPATLAMRVAATTVAVVVTVLIVAGAVEVAARAFPESLVPLGWLKRFSPGLRAEIAEKLELPRRAETLELSRDDGGPSLRVFKPGTRTRQKFAADEVSVVKFDGQGFCNPTLDGYRRDRFDVIVLGDSFTTCTATSAAATWMARLGEVAGMSTYNLGKGGIGPYEYLQFFKHYGRVKKPAYVVMNIYEGNDIRDADRYHKHVAAGRDGRVLYARADDRFEPELDYNGLLDNWLGRHSYAANMALVAIGKSATFVHDNIVGGEVEEPVDMRYTLAFPGAKVPFNVDNVDDDEARYAMAVEAGEVSFAVFDQALAGFAALAREDGFQPLVTYSPAAYTAYAEFAEFDEPGIGELMRRFSAAQRAYLERKCGELDLPFHDLTPDLAAAIRERQESDLLYYPTNVHYSESGHAVVGDAVGGILGAMRASTTADAPEPVDSNLSAASGGNAAP